MPGRCGDAQEKIVGQLPEAGTQCAACGNPIHWSATGVSCGCLALVHIDCYLAADACPKCGRPWLHPVEA